MEIELKSLKESIEFLNILMDNITSAVFLVDKEVRLQQFNNSFQKLFSKPEAELINQLCGNALGCSFAVDQGKSCGQTSNCEDCVLRNSILRAFIEDIPTFRSTLHREFYIGNVKIEKYFLFSTMYLDYHSEQMILVIVDDFTERETHRLQLLEKQRRLDEDLQAAAGIQQSLLPASFPLVENFRFATRFIPCESVGGDIFNVFQLDEERIVVFILDVSGHGIPAALVTVSVSQMLNPTTGYFCNRNGAVSFVCPAGLASPKEVLQALDAAYPLERFDKYFTMSYVVLNRREGTLLYSNAGHPPPVLLRADGRVELLDQGGTIVGLGGIIPFEEEAKIVSSRDKVIFYTDGLTEYTNGAGEAYGTKRFLGELRNMTEAGAEEIVDALIASVLEFGDNASPNDDIALVVVDFLGP